MLRGGLLGISQRDLAEAATVSLSAILDFETAHEIRAQRRWPPCAEPLRTRACCSSRSTAVDRAFACAIQITTLGPCQDSPEENRRLNRGAP